MNPALALVATVAIATVGASPALAAPAPMATSWTAHPIKGFSGTLMGLQPKLDSSAAGQVTAAWFGSLPESLLNPGNVLVSTYDGKSWGCPIQLPGTTPPTDGVPPAFDVGTDGTVAIAANGWIPDPFSVPQPPAEDVWVSVRPAGETAFTGGGTGQGFPATEDPVVATSSARTVVVWVTGTLSTTKLMAAEFLPGAKRATPLILASSGDIAFPKVRMDQAGNAVVVFRSITSGGDLQQNWLVWPQGGTPGSSTAFPVVPDDFVEISALSVSPAGRMIIAMNNGRQGDRDPEVRDFVGTTTTGFTGSSVIVSGDPLPSGNFVTAIDDDGHATVAFRMDAQEDTRAKAHIYSVDSQTGAPGTHGTFTEPGETGISLFRVFQDDATAYVSWTDSNLNAMGGGVVSFAGGQVVREMTTSQSDWVGVVAGPSGPVAYWPRQQTSSGWSGTLTTTLPHKPLNAKPTLTKASISRTGKVTVSGKVTPAPAATACAGAPVSLSIRDTDYGFESALLLANVAKDGSFTATGLLSAFTSCKKANVTALLSTPDSPKPATVGRSVACSRR